MRWIRRPQVIRHREQKAEEALKGSEHSLAEATTAKEQQQALRQAENENVTQRLERLTRESGNHLGMRFLEAFTEKHGRELS